MFIEHDDIGCKHSACECKMTQPMMMGQRPTLSSLMFGGSAENYWEPTELPIERYGISFRRERIIPEKIYVREYRNTDPDKLFAIAAGSFQKIEFFKVWKADAKARHIDMTTYGTSTIKDGWREQIDVRIIEDTDTSSVRIEITPSMEPGVMGWFAWYSKKGVKEKTADLVAKMIFDELDAKTGSDNATINQKS